MTASALLAEIHARGATVRVEGQRLKVRPKAVVLDLAPEILKQAAALAAAVQAAPAPTPQPQTGCIDCHADLGPGVAAGLCFPCRQRRNPEATPVEALPVEAWRGEPEHTTYRFRVVIDACEPVAGPVELRPAVVVTDVRRAVWHLLVDLIAAAEVFGETCADGGDDRLYRLAVEAGQDVERLIDDLATLGCRVRVARVQ